MRTFLISIVALLVLASAFPVYADRPAHESYYSEHHLEEYQRLNQIPKGILPPGAFLRPGDALWSPNGEFQLLFQRDGNLVLYRKGRPLWSTGTNDREVRECVMQPDGNLVLYGRGRIPVWASSTQGNHGAFLSLQNDGNMVIYRPAIPVWASGTNR
jgi:hypothetical protein